MKKSIIATFATLLVLVCLITINSGFKYFGGQKAWTVPDAAKNKKNPVANNAESVAAGKALWSTHCKSCHGNKGLGDGSKAAQLKTEPGDFSSAAFQSQTDGAIFFKTSEGRDDMPSFKRKLPDDDDRWNLVNYMRSLKK